MPYNKSFKPISIPLRWLEVDEFWRRDMETQEMAYLYAVKNADVWKLDRVVVEVPTQQK